MMSFTVSGRCDVTKPKELGMFGNVLPDVKIDANVARISDIRSTLLLKNHYHVECRGVDGSTKWIDEFDNLVVNVGLNDVLDKYLKGSSYTAAFYVGLASTAPTFAAADTMASHGGWTEVTGYSESVRQTLVLGTVSSQSVSNTASKAVFTANASITVGGAFIATVSTKSNTSGTLYAGGAFTGGDKSLVSGETLTITITCTATAS